MLFVLLISIALFPALSWATDFTGKAVGITDGDRVKAEGYLPMRIKIRKGDRLLFRPESRNCWRI